MAWTLPGSATTGNVIPAAWGNDVNGDLTILETTVGLYGAGSAMAGSPPSPTTPVWYIQGGTFVGTTGTGGTVGQMVMSFPTAFPNGLLTCTGLNGDYGSGANFVVSLAASASAAGVTWFIQNANTNTAASGITFRVNWMAIGF